LTEHKEEDDILRRFAQEYASKINAKITAESLAKKDEEEDNVPNRDFSDADLARLQAQMKGMGS